MFVRIAIGVAALGTWGSHTATTPPAACPADEALTVKAGCDDLVLSEEPVTVELTPSDGFWRQLRETVAGDAWDSTTVRLRVAGLEPGTSSALSGARVFLNVPRVDGTIDSEALSTRAPYYVGSFRFFPGDGGGAGAFYVDPTDALKRLVDSNECPKDEALTVTLVGLLAKGDAVDRDRSVPFSEVTLTILPRTPR